MIRVVSLDLWGTLIDMGDRDAARAWRLREFALVLEEFGHPVDAGALQEATDDAHREHLRRQRHHGEQLAPRAQIADVLARLDVPFRDDLLDVLVVVHTHAVLRACPEPAPGAHEVLRQLHDSGRRVVVSSNTLTSVGKVVRSILEYRGLADLVDGVYFSDELGVAKPHPSYFRAVADEVHADPTEILHLGDDWRTDVRGATEAGWQAVWFNPAGATAPAMAVVQDIARFDMLVPLLDLPSTAPDSAPFPRRPTRKVAGGPIS
ncbi:HAD family hydrolase [Plantactinospora mayteni]|uniref:2-haloalkanoic acid dehalogenase n=1 Tax=Plantactinospora mayteni TaxID=566021 RepID=A0ABQ4EIG6_9ACTN|nr:HAD family hydrolase [Plantactinospora mayteni]GIG94528.1 2-haloalkanoic acid dehalogenase [Plantactinospora mayteni]